MFDLLERPRKPDYSQEPVTKAFNVIVGPFIIGGILVGMAGSAIVLGIVATALWLIRHF